MIRSASGPRGIRAGRVTGEDLGPPHPAAPSIQTGPALPERRAARTGHRGHGAGKRRQTEPDSIHVLGQARIRPFPGGRERGFPQPVHIPAAVRAGESGPAARARPDGRLPSGPDGPPAGRGPPVTWRPPLRVPPSRAKGATPARAAARRLPTAPGPPARATGDAAVTGPMPGTGAGCRSSPPGPPTPRRAPRSAGRTRRRRRRSRRGPSGRARPRPDRRPRPGPPRPGAPVDGRLAQDRHVAEPVDGPVRRRRGRHVRERGAQGGRHARAGPVGLRRLAAGPGEVPGLARVATTTLRPRSCRDCRRARCIRPVASGTARAAFPSPGGGRPCGSRPCRWSRSRPARPGGCPASSCSRRFLRLRRPWSPAPVLATVRFPDPASIGTREDGGRTGRPRCPTDPLARSRELSVRPALRGQAPHRRRQALAAGSRTRHRPGRRREARDGLSTGNRLQPVHGHLPWSLPVRWTCEEPGRAVRRSPQPRRSARSVPRDRCRAAPERRRIEVTEREDPRAAAGCRERNGPGRPWCRKRGEAGKRVSQFFDIRVFRLRFQERARRTRTGRTGRRRAA